MKEVSRLALLWLFFCCFILSVFGAETPADPGERWVKKSQQPNLKPYEVEAYKQLARVHLCQFQQWNNRGAISILSFEKESKEPMDVLHAMGLKVLPVLSEALSDDTPSQTVTTVRRSDKHVWKVNELVARLIRRLADREFVIGEWGPGKSVSDISHYPELTDKFQQLILKWYAENKDRTEEERKIADLESNLRNRLDAMIWLGKHQSRQAAPAIAKRIEQILDGDVVSSSTQAELAEASLALGRIGDVSARPAVKKACDHLSYWIYMSYRPIEQGRSGHGSSQIANLFQAYHGMSLLGQKQEALTELERLFRKYGQEIEGFTREDYEKLLKEAENWKAAGGVPDQ